MKASSQFSLILCAGFLILSDVSLLRGGTIRVVDTKTNGGVVSDIYHVDSNDQKHRVGKTNTKGICIVRESGKQGEKYIAISEEYNPGETECPVANATISVSRTTLLRDYLLKAEFLASAGNPAAAALEFRKAAVIAEKQDPRLFETLEYKVADSVAKGLKVDKPFVKTGSGLTASEEFRKEVKKYQRKNDLKETGSLNRETLKAMAYSGDHGSSF